MARREDIFDSKRTKDLFRREDFTKMELEKTLWSGKPLKSRHSENISYIFRDGLIQTLETRNVSKRLLKLKKNGTVKKKKKK